MNSIFAFGCSHRRLCCHSHALRSRSSSSSMFCRASRHHCTAAVPRRRRAVDVRSQHNFVLYTKPDCPLCDGLKDKVQALLDRSQFMQCFLTGSSLEVRDISTNEAWQDAMHLSVPVLAVIDDQGQEVVLPRPPPRITAERLQRHLEEGLQRGDDARAVSS